jgi:hypothetical protein
MFISFDNGAHWQPFSLNTPNVPINDIKLKNRDLIVVTQGRAAWILDNVSALHQITPQIAATEPHLYEPRDGYRTRTGTNILGPSIDYYLPSEPAGGVTIDILDPSGAVVNSYRSSTAMAASAGGGRGGRGGNPDAAMMEGRFRGGRGGSGGPRATANFGHNRFVWDAQHSSGLPVPPGAYGVRLTTGDRTFTESFDLLIDPRLEAEGINAADLRQQFEHNTRMRDMVQEVNALVQRVRNEQSRLEGAAGANEQRRQPVDALLDQLVAGTVLEARTPRPHPVPRRHDSAQRPEGRQPGPRAVRGVARRARSALGRSRPAPRNRGLTRSETGARAEAEAASFSPALASASCLTDRRHLR